MLTFSKGTLDQIIETNACDAKHSFAGLGYVKITSTMGTLTAFSTHINVTAILTVDNFDGEDGEAILSLGTLKALQDAMGKNGASRMITFNGEMLTGGSVSLPATTLDPESFPSTVLQYLSPPCEENRTEFDAGELLTALNAVGHAQGEDTSRPNLCGIFVDVNPKDKMRFVTTDGHRLSTYELDALEHGAVSGKTLSFILPDYAIKPLKKALKGASDVCVYTDGNFADFHIGDLRIIAKTPDQTFPDYRQVIPKEARALTYISLSPKTFVKALKVKGYKSMVFYPNKVTLTNVDLGNMDLKGLYPEIGDSEFKVAFNLQYIVEACTAPTTVEARFFGGLSPATFTYNVGNAKVVNVVMPMRC